MRNEAALRSRVAPFLAMEVFKEAAALESAGRRIIRMETGEPSAPAPRMVREAAIQALQNGRIGYTQSLGLPSLRARIARHYQEAYGVHVPMERVAVTTGSSGGFILAFLSLFDAGARVAVAAPGYPAYRNILEAIDVEVVTLETTARDRHVVTAAMIEAAHAQRPLDGVLLMSPANPTGTMMSDAALAEISATCQRLGIAFVSDEIYHGLTYERTAQTALAFSDQAVIVNSFSKYYCMTGWRIGWLVLPDWLIRSVERLSQSFAISPPTLSQIAAEKAFDALEDLETVKAGYARNRALLIRELPRIGLGDFHPADGAFYLYCNVSRFTNDSLDFCKRMLSEAGVAATPGVDFDREHGSSAVRFSFAGAHDDIVEALERLQRWLPTS
ncbi:aminotransferase class I/II-fold pyridoxal phosphate-dependent enzyme [Methylocella sp. CPCC 101449]|jgi:aspartate/methionine/tyrosine aminotransferase|uniref:pyridoxal phosphate-dependent aminotransferase n=1 Tax=Methylocella sp. CPCC 101449 TaxID=2987531 RepID=UPI0028905CBA|nr:aminotransferase class I/II-fold pyridoxal phosphate-dependent enzyme [Methylocella sp. CPCC 101449]MDT2022330.1 aminotransferase class I/II-fold pyridoxal phosphate-dependent enzyme [Methylocella sp. CPCC 101449]HEV2572942.1 aminotransferase class I/II-fold pyridoxal phosphate-dependent enzyme [Beijerinckiaceae bacterium]